jgi:hypothetical protein
MDWTDRTSTLISSISVLPLKLPNYPGKALNGPLAREDHPAIFLIQPAFLEQGLDPPEVLFIWPMLEDRYERGNERGLGRGEVLFVVVGGDGLGFKQQDGDFRHLCKYLFKEEIVNSEREGSNAHEAVERDVQYDREAGQIEGSRSIETTS